jgi:hypothetical protein
VLALHGQGDSVRTIARRTGLSRQTTHRIVATRPKPPAAGPVPAPEPPAPGPEPGRDARTRSGRLSAADGPGRSARAGGRRGRQGAVPALLAAGAAGGRSRARAGSAVGHVAADPGRGLGRAAAPAVPVVAVLPDGEETLRRCRDAVLAAAAAPGVDAAWGEALAALDIDASAVCLADLPALLTAMHTAATLAVVIARREVLLLGGDSP